MSEESSRRTLTRRPADRHASTVAAMGLWFAWALVRLFLKLARRRR
jgi:hypothetical protein